MSEALTPEPDIGREGTRVELADLVVRYAIGERLARRVANAAVARAEERQVAVSIAVCDDSGFLVAFVRLDGAPLASILHAQVKARTTVGFNMPTGAWHEMAQGDPLVAIGLCGALGEFAIFGGGVPIVVDGGIVGSIGVSGGSEAQDEEIATAGAGAA